MCLIFQSRRNRNCWWYCHIFIVFSVGGWLNYRNKPKAGTCRTDVHHTQSTCSCTGITPLKATDLVVLGFFPSQRMAMPVCITVLTLITLYLIHLLILDVFMGVCMILEKLAVSKAVKQWQSSSLMYPSSVWLYLFFSFPCSENFYVK